MARASNSPRWYLIPVRAALVTFIGTLLCLAIALFLGIVGTVVVSALRHVHPDMRIAYRHVALPSAVIGGAIILVLSLAMEIRHYRQSKTLAAIAKMSADHPLPTI
jgi:H+/Cl- antiporter ClcA